MGKLVPTQVLVSEEQPFSLTDFYQDRAQDTIKQMTGGQIRKNRPGKKTSGDGAEMQTFFTLASKSIYTNANDEAIHAMYERKINIKDLQIWLRRNQSIPTQRLNQRLSLSLDFDFK